MIRRFQHHRIAQGKLGATDKYPYTVTQTLFMHTQTDKLWVLTLRPTCFFSISGEASFESCTSRTNTSYNCLTRLCHFKTASFWLTSICPVSELIVKVDADSSNVPLILASVTRSKEEQEGFILLVLTTLKAVLLYSMPFEGVGL